MSSAGFLWPFSGSSVSLLLALKWSSQLWQPMTKLPLDPGGLLEGVPILPLLCEPGNWWFPCAFHHKPETAPVPSTPATPSTSASLWTVLDGHFGVSLCVPPYKVY